MCARLNRKMRVAATKIAVPISKLCEFYVGICSVKTYNAVAAITTALPNIQQIEILNFESKNGLPHKFVDCDDPDADLTVSTAYWPAHNIPRLIIELSKTA